MAYLAPSTESGLVFYLRLGSRQIGRFQEQVERFNGLEVLVPERFRVLPGIGLSTGLRKEV